LRKSEIFEKVSYLTAQESHTMAKEIDINKLAQAMDNTWGRSSTPKTASYSVKFTFLGSDRILASYQVVTNFVSEREMIGMKRKCEEESDDVIKAHVDLVKKTYKELTGQSLTLREADSTDSLEIVGFNVHNPKRTALFRRKVTFELA
jgi:hypothetical protein